MRLRSALIALLVVLAGAIASAAAAQSRDDDYVLVFRPDSPNCPRGQRPRVTVTRLAADPKPYLGRCVRVSGVWSGRELYADLDAYHRRGGRHTIYDDITRPRTFQVGVYAPDDLIKLKGGSYDTPTAADMIARVGDCEDLWKGALFVAGYCHSDFGAYLAVEDADLAPLRLARLVSDKDRFQVGDLAVAPKDWAHRGAQEKLIRDWMRAFAAREEKALIELYGLSGPQLDQARKWSDTPGVSPPAPAYADFQTYRPGRQVEVFLEKPHDASGPDSSREGWDWDSIGCVCREADCTGRWPIGRMDARNNPMRPYVCLEFSRVGPDNEPPRWQLRAHLDERRMIEPGR